MRYDITFGLGLRFEVWWKLYAWIWEIPLRLLRSAGLCYGVEEKGDLIIAFTQWRWRHMYIIYLSFIPTRHKVLWNRLGRISSVFHFSRKKPLRSFILSKDMKRSAYVYIFSNNISNLVLFWRKSETMDEYRVKTDFSVQR